MAPKKKQTPGGPPTAAAVSAAAARSDGIDDLPALVLERNKLSSTIEQLQAELDATEEQRAAVDRRIQLIEFDRSVAADTSCAKLLSAFTASMEAFQASLSTPKNYDNEVPFRCSDDYADTSPFDDWVDAALEQHREREQAGDGAGALRVLLRASELMQEAVEAVEKADGADSGIVLESRERLLVAWEEVAGNLREIFSSAEEEQADEEGGSFSAATSAASSSKEEERRKNMAFVESISPTLFSVRARLEKLGKPFVSVFD